MTRRKTTACLMRKKHLKVVNASDYFKRNPPTHVVTIIKGTLAPFKINVRDLGVSG